MSCTTYPGIREIYIVGCQSLPRNIELSSRAGIPVQLPFAPRELPFIGVPRLNVIDKIVNNTLQYTATLELSVTLQVRRELLESRRPMAYIVITNDNSIFLLGSHEPPFPSAEKSNDTGTPSGDGAKTSIKVVTVSSAPPARVSW